MNRLRVLGVLLVIVCVAAVASVGAAEGKAYGKGVKLATATPVEQLLGAPKTFLGKTVRVDGIVTAVCDKAGCWMDLRDEKADPKTAKTLRMKVNDGEISFPVSAKGKKASIEGVFEPVGEAMAKEYAADAKEAKAGSEMKTPAPSYQLKGTGAIIY
jgi:hypothetical protein